MTTAQFFAGIAMALIGVMAAASVADVRRNALLQQPMRDGAREVAWDVADALRDAVDVR